MDPLNESVNPKPEPKAPPRFEAPSLRAKRHPISPPKAARRSKASWVLLGFRV